MNKERELYELFEDHIIEQRDTPKVFPSVHGEGGHVVRHPEIPAHEVDEELNDAPGG